jgi:hypothetical protein
VTADGQESGVGDGLGILGLMFGVGNGRLLVGVEADPEEAGGFRVYLNHRASGLHTHVPADAPDEDRAQLAQLAAGGWAQHLIIDVPVTALCDCRPDLTPGLLDRRRPGADAQPVYDRFEGREVVDVDLLGALG